MIVEKIEDKLYSHQAYGSVGYGQYYGNAYNGQAKYGNDAKILGVYQLRYKKKNRKGGQQVVRMKFYRTSNPKSEKQIAIRQKFKEAVEFYKTLKNQGDFEAVKSFLKGVKKIDSRVIHAYMKDKPNLLGLTSFN